MEPFGPTFHSLGTRQREPLVYTFQHKSDSLGGVENTRRSGVAKSGANSYLCSQDLTTLFRVQWQHLAHKLVCILRNSGNMGDFSTPFICFGSSGFGGANAASAGFLAILTPTPIGVLVASSKWRTIFSVGRWLTYRRPILAQVGAAHVKPPFVWRDSS